MTGTIISSRYVRGERAELVQGIKGNQRPRGAIHGSNGSFIVLGDPAKVVITIQLENNEIHKENIYYLMKDAGCKRVTENKADILGANLVGKKVFFEDGEFTNLAQLVNEYMK